MAIAKRGETAMAATHITRQELAHRMSNGIEVTLYWNTATNRVSIEVSDARFDDRFEFEVPGNDALDAFHHPYAYAPARLRALPVLAC
jgi:hypothetical protein